MVQKITNIMAVKKAIDGDTIETIIFAHYGRQNAELLDLVLMADGNENLPKQGIFLAPGTSVILPAIEVKDSVKSLTRIQNLWD